MIKQKTGKLKLETLGYVGDIFKPCWHTSPSDSVEVNTKNVLYMWFSRIRWKILVSVGKGDSGDSRVFPAAPSDAGSEFILHFGRLRVTAD